MKPVVSTPGRRRARPWLIGTIVAITILTALAASGFFVYTFAQRTNAGATSTSSRAGHARQSAEPPAVSAGMARATSTSSQAGHSQSTSTHLAVYVGTATGALNKLDARTGHLDWSFQSGGKEIPAPATDSNGVIYLGGLDGTAYALNAATGKPLWEYKTQGAILASPVVSNGVVYIASSNGNLYALSAQNGAKIWLFHAALPSNVATVQQVSVANGSVYGSSNDPLGHSYLFSLDTHNGAPRWQREMNVGIFSAPQVSGQNYYIASSSSDAKSSFVYAFRTSDGAQLWRSTSINNAVQSAPTVNNGSVYVGSQASALYAFDARTGVQQWRHSAAGSVSSARQVVNGILFTGIAGAVTQGTSSTSDSALASSYIVAINSTTGSTVWQRQLANYTGAAPVSYAGSVYIGTGDNTVYSLNAQSGALNWSNQQSAVPGLMTNAPLTVGP